MANRFTEGFAAAIFRSARHRKTTRHRVLASASTAILGLAAMLAGGLWATATPVPQESPAEDYSNPIAGYLAPDITPVEQLVAGLEGEEIASDALENLARFFETAPADAGIVSGPLGFSEWLQHEGAAVSDPSQTVQDVEILLDAMPVRGSTMVFEIHDAGETEFSIGQTGAGPVSDPETDPEPQSQPEPQPQPQPEPQPELEPEPEPEPQPQPDPTFQIEYHDAGVVTLFTFNENTRDGWTTADDGSALALPEFMATLLYAEWEEAGADDAFLVVDANDLFDNALMLDNTFLEASMGFEM